jgi:hypothetical protein
VHAARTARDLGSPHAFVALGSRRAFDERVAPSAVGDDLPSAVANLLVLPANMVPWALGVSEARVGFTIDGAVGATVNLDRGVGRREQPFGAVLLRSRGGADGPLEERWILWTPAEATQAVGRRWREEFGGSGPAFLFGLTNGSMAYLADAEEFDRGGYEAALTLYGRHAADLVTETLRAAAEAVR